MAQPEELESISRLLAGELSQEEADALEAVILQRPDLADARRRLETLIFVSESLPTDVTEERATRLVGAVLPRARASWLWWFLGVAAAVAIVVLVLVLRPREPVRRDAPIASPVRIEEPDGTVIVNGEPLHGDRVSPPGCVVETAVDSTVRISLGSVVVVLAPNSRLTIPADPTDHPLALTAGVAELTNPESVSLEVGDSFVQTQGVLLAVVEPGEAFARVTEVLRRVAPPDARGTGMRTLFKSLHLPALALSTATVVAAIPIEGSATVTPPDGGPTQLTPGETWQPTQPASPAAESITPAQVVALTEQVRALQADKAALQQQLADLTRKVNVPVSPVAAAPSFGAAQTTGYFDVKRIIQGADEASDKRKTLERDVKEKQKRLDDMKTELESMQRDYEAKKSALSPSAQRDQEGKIQEKAVKAQNTYMELQQELAKKEQEALGELLQKLEPVVQELAQEEGYTYVFEKNEAGLAYAPAARDLTSELIRRYNQRYPSKGTTKTVP